MNIGDANLLNKLSPFVALVCAAIFLKERFTIFHFIAVLGAFIGCAFVIPPSLDFAEATPALIAITGGFGAGIALTLVHALGRRNENGIRVIFYFSVFSTLATVPYLFFNAAPMASWQFFSMLMAGLLAGLGQYFITKAYFFAAPRDISVFDFSQVIFSAVFGFLFFGEFPGSLSFVGYVLIISMGVLLFFYNRRSADHAE